MLRITHADNEPRVDVYHDSVRRAVLRHGEPERIRVINRRFAEILAQRANPPAARIAEHWLSAGEPAAAVAYLLDGARVARSQLALERAVGLYRRALESYRVGTGSEFEPRSVRIRVELAELLRDFERREDALLELDLVEAQASALDLAHEQATAHYLRGSLLFGRGDIDGCAREHQRARELAHRAGSAKCEARALSGLGDAAYLRGDMDMAYGFFDECLQLCDDRRLDHPVAVNLAMRGLTGMYLGRLRGSVVDVRRARDLAVEQGNRRAESVIRGACLSPLLLELGDTDAAVAEADAGLRAAVRLGVARLLSMAQIHAGIALGFAGRRREAERLLTEALDADRRADSKFMEPVTLAMLAWVTSDPGARRRALAEGELSLAASPLSHNVLYFHRLRIENGLEHGEFDAVERSVSALREYSEGRGLGCVQAWCDCAEARVALARHGRRDSDLARARALRDRLLADGYCLTGRALADALG